MAANLPILVLFLITLMALWLAGRALFNRRWFLGWLRGTIGLLMLVVSAACSLLVYDLSHYRDLSGGGYFVTVSSKSEGAGGWQLRIAGGQGDPVEQIVDGDLWSLTARYIKFGSASVLIQPRSVTGRYYSLSKENAAIRFPGELFPADRSIADSWPLIIGLAEIIPFLDAGLIHLYFTPLVDNGLYEVSYKPHSLVVKPLNEPAASVLNTSS